MEGLKKIGTIVVSVILWMVILLASLFAFTTLATKDVDHVASLAGFTPLSIESESMAPTFDTGDMIMIHTVDPNTLQVGDIITFRTIIENQYALNTHRIESISDENGARSYVTKGDNNALADTHAISDGDIVGKEVFVMRGMGKVIDFLSGTLGFLLVIVLPMLLFFIYQVYHLITIVISLKRATAEEDRMAEAERIVAQEKAAAEGAEAHVAKEPASDELDEAARMRAEAEATLAEAKRLKEEAEALAAKNANEQ